MSNVALQINTLMVKLGVKFWGGTWKQTSYNNKFRKQFAGVG